MPTEAEFAAAVSTTRPAAAAAGLSLHTDGLLLTLLRARAPLLATRAGQRCTIGYSSYTPGRDYAWLFPYAAPHDRQLWLAALVRHELAHCIDAAASPGPLAAAGGLGAQRVSEAHADLAFALYVDEHSDRADALIEQLATLRARRTSGDPDHDTAAALRCYLAHPLRDPSRVGMTDDVDRDWPLRLAAWGMRCVDRADAPVLTRTDPG